jgi:hypothetical protein
MAARKAGWCGAVVSAVFGGVVAPVAVSVLTEGLKGRADAPAAPDGGRVRVLVVGLGRTPTEALRDAQRGAVRRVAAGCGPADTSAVEAAAGRADDFVLRIEDLGGGPQGGFCRKEMAITVSRRAVADALRRGDAARRR